ncbi:MAG: outer membrane lipoprotein-sorting protein [Sedimentisphaerales bacterium]|nr:outer membrane lipoprotein-sorting protein [Sedimentisphaerales bacterium]
MKISAVITVVILTLSCYNLAAESDVPPVDEIVTKANLAAYYQGDDGKAKVTMTITDKKGDVRNREFIILRKDIADGGDQNYYVYFLRPADVYRMVFMVNKHAADNVDDDRWLYLPALDLIRRIAAGDKRTSFVGSDFLYEDVSGRNPIEDKHELADSNQSMFVLKNTPQKSDTVEFSYYLVYIDRKNYMPMKMEYFDKQNRLYRTIESLEVKDISGFATVTKAKVSDLNTGSTTLMEFNDVQYNIGIGDIFTERYLRKPPTQVRR